jgi:hypothetical protein
VACIDPDGSLTNSGRRILEFLAKEPLPPDALAQATGEPLFQVRGRIREMVEAELIAEVEGNYAATEKGLGMI